MIGSFIRKNISLLPDDDTRRGERFLDAESDNRLHAVVDHESPPIQEGSVSNDLELFGGTRQFKRFASE